jgi:hypothetical protein
MYQQLWGYKVEEKLYLGVCEQKKVEHHCSTWYEYGALVEWYLQGKTEELKEKSVLVPLYPSQIPYELTQVQTWASVVRDWWITTWAIVWPFSSTLLVPPGHTSPPIPNTTFIQFLSAANIFHTTVKRLAKPCLIPYSSKHVLPIGFIMPADHSLYMQVQA